MTDELRSLTDLATLEQLIRTQGVEALRSALDEAITRLPPEARVQLEGGPTVGPRTLRVIRGALALDAGFLRAHPEALFQCLYNRLRWFDAPDAAAHFTSSAHGPWTDADAHLHVLAGHWRRQRDARGASPWLESLLPLRGELDSGDQLFRGPRVQVLCAAYSPSGDRLATGSWDDGDNVRIWDVATSTCLQVMRGHECEVLDVAWSPDGRKLASGSRDHDVRLWDVATGELLHEMTGQEGRVTAVAFSPDGRLVAAANLGWIVRLFDVASGEAVRTLEGHEQSVLCVSFHPSGRVLATGSSDDTVRIWEVETGAQVACISTQTMVQSVAFSPDGEWLALPADGGIVLVETRQWTRARMAGGERPYSQVEWIGNDKLGVLAYDRVEVLDARTGEVIRSRPQVSDGFERRVAFPPGGQRFAVTAADGVVRVSDLASEPAPTLLPDQDQARSVWGYPEAGLAVVSAAHAYLVVDSRGGLHRAHRKHTLLASPDPWVASPDGTMLAYAFTLIEPEGSRAAVQLLDAKTLAPVRALSVRRVGSSEDEAPYLSERPMAFSPDGKTLAAVLEAGVVRLWRVSDGALLHTLRGHDGPITLLRFTPDGACVVSGSQEDSRLVLHEVKGGKGVVDTEASMEPEVSYAAASRAPLIAVGRRTGEMELFDLAEGSQRRIRVTEGRVFGVALSADGMLAAACGQDGMVRLFHARTGELLHALQHPALPLYAALGDGGVITLSNDHQVRFFDVATGALRAEFPGNLSPEDVVKQDIWECFGDESFALHQRQDPTPLVHFHDPLEQSALLRQSILVGRGRSEPGAFYILRLHLPSR